MEYCFDTGDPGASFRWEYSADNSTWYGDKNLSTYQQSGGGHAGTDANANWTGGTFFNTTSDNTDGMKHASVSQIIDVSSLSATTPRYWRVTMRQTDASNNEIRINYQASTGGYAPTGASSFNVIELGA